MASSSRNTPLHKRGLEGVWMKGKSTLAGSLLAAVALLLSGPAAAAQGHGHGQAKKADKAEAKHKAHDEKHGDDGDIFDRDGHVRVIHEYQRDGLPPGLAKRQSLPPGLQKQL